MMTAVTRTRKGTKATSSRRRPHLLPRTPIWLANPLAESVRGLGKTPAILMNNSADLPPVISPHLRPDRTERFFRWMGGALVICVLLLALAAYGVTGYFRLS